MQNLKCHYLNIYSFDKQFIYQEAMSDKAEKARSQKTADKNKIDVKRKGTEEINTSAEKFRALSVDKFLLEYVKVDKRNLEKVKSANANDFLKNPSKFMSLELDDRKDLQSIITVLMKVNSVISGSPANDLTISQLIERNLMQSGLTRPLLSLFRNKLFVESGDYLRDSDLFLLAQRLLPADGKYHNLLEDLGFPKNAAWARHFQIRKDPDGGIYLMKAHNPKPSQAWKWKTWETKWNDKKQLFENI